MLNQSPSFASDDVPIDYGNNQGSSLFSIFQNTPEGLQYFPPSKKLEDGTKVLYSGPITFSILPTLIVSPNHHLVQAGKAKPGMYAIYTQYARHKLSKEEGHCSDATLLGPETLGKPCPLCDERENYVQSHGGWKAMNQQDRDYANSLRPQTRMLFWIKIESGEYADQVMLYDTFYADKATNTTPFKTLLDQAASQYIATNELSRLNYADPVNGVSISAYIKIAQFGARKYPTLNNVTFIPRKTAVTQQDLAKTFDPSQYFYLKSYEEIKGLLLGTMEAYEDQEAEGYEEGTEGFQAPASIGIPPGGSVRYEEDEDEEAFEDTIENAQAQVFPASGVLKRPVVLTQEPPVTQEQPVKPVLKCPHLGRFGRDLGKLAECPECAIYLECRDAFGKTRLAQ